MNSKVFRIYGRASVFGAILLLFVPALYSCAEKVPVIDSINPPLGTMGGVLTIQGKNFGDQRAESYVTIAGTAPTSSSYSRWQDDLISLTIPEFGGAGLIYVHVDGKKSNGLLFANEAAIPRQVQGSDIGIGPRVASVNPQTGSVGALITISGSGFGNSRERSGVFFSWNAETSLSALAEAKTPEAVEVFDADFGYELWSEREIRVRIPDGAVSGNLEVRTPRGNSRPVFFEISGKPGTKTFKEKKNYTISYSVDIQTNEASEPNTLYLWMPQPGRSASQRNAELLSRSMEPFIENYRGTTLFQLNNLASGSSAVITQTYVVEVYSQETNIRLQSVRQEEGSPVASVFTLPSPPLIPSNDPGIIARANAIVGRERNPYVKAQRIYEWLITEAQIQAGPLVMEIPEALEKKQADPYTAALLFCALARAAGIPCLPAAGVLVNRNRGTSRHFWAEFWIDGFGWIPVDPALGAGAAPPSFNLRSDRASYYFGNLDNQRITFSRGLTALSQMDVRGRSAGRSREYALQNLWEEAAGGLESYSSLWGDVTITGTYVQ
jgi:hypothetical protein